MVRRSAAPEFREPIFAGYVFRTITAQIVPLDEENSVSLVIFCLFGLNFPPFKVFFSLFNAIVATKIRRTVSGIAFVFFFLSF